MTDNQWGSDRPQPDDSQPSFYSREAQGSQGSAPQWQTPHNDPWQPRPAATPPLPPQPAIATATLPPKPAKARMLPTLVACAVLSAGVGGATALGVTTYLTPETTTVSTAGGSTVTKVVQGDSSAPDWTVTAAQASKSTVSISVSSARGQASGSGVVFDDAGNIVTNNHVATALGSDAKIVVQIGDRQFEAAIVGADPSSDLAVLKLTNPPSDLVPIQFANSNDVKVGDPVMAIGNPLGLSGTVTTGIVSALNRPVTTSSGSQAIVTNAIQTSAAINPGNSGGALVNASGELIGINTAIASLGSSQGGQSGNIGIGFAIESNLVKNVAQQIISTGTANHAWMGVSARDDAAALSGSQIVGARITQVSANSPAQAAGLQAGDLVTAVSGRTVSSLEGLVAVVRAQPIGEKVEVSFVRDGTLQTATVTLVASPTTTR